MKQGIIYTATGEKYVKQAKLSATSVKGFNSSINTTLFTDQPQELTYEYFDNIFPVEPTNSSRNQYMLDRLMVFQRTPYEYTLALDTDTYIFDDISEMFNILDRFDLAMCHGHTRALRYSNALKDGKALPEIPYAFAPVQGGLMLYKRNEKVDKYLRDLVELYKEKQYADDQVSMRELLWKNDLRVYILPREYNFNSIKDVERWAEQDFKTARPKIFHYTHHKKNEQDIKKLVQPFIKHLHYSPTPSLEHKTNWRFTSLMKRINQSFRTLKGN